LEIVSGEKKTLHFFNTVFINPDIYLNGTRLDDPERSKSERVELLSIFLKHLESFLTIWGILCQYMSGFMKTVLKTLHQKSHIHFDFTNPKDLEITPNDENKQKQTNKKRQRDREKREIKDRRKKKD
jgi:hypothetical protein